MLQKIASYGKRQEKIISDVAKNSKCIEAKNK